MFFRSDFGIQDKNRKKKYPDWLVCGWGMAVCPKRIACVPTNSLSVHHEAQKTCIFEAYLYIILNVYIRQHKNSML